jgi:hypothetical protein
MRGLFMLAAALLSPVLTAVGVDLLVGNFTSDTFKCFKEAGYDFVVVKAYKANGTP